MKFLFALLLFAWHCMPVLSQTHGQQNNTSYKAAVRFNFTGLADPIDNNISAGGEYVFHPNWSVTADLAYIEYSAYFSSIQRTSGYIVKPAIRYYPSVSHGGFLEAVLFYKHVNYQLEDWLGKDCVHDVPAYEEYKKFTFGKRVKGINFQAGFQTSLSRNKLFRFEGYIGLGIRFKLQHVVSEENSCYDLNRTFIDLRGRSGSSVLSSLPMGMRVVYCIRK